MRRFLFIFVVGLSSLLSACGGGGPPPVPAVISPVATVINGIPVPPDPGPANDQTLAGIDSNGNGVRDDVERAIAQAYGGAPAEWKAAMQGAQALQQTMVANGNPALAAVANDAAMRAGYCLADSFPAADTSKVARASGTMFAWTAGTPQRLAAFDATQTISTPFQYFSSGKACE